MMDDLNSDEVITLLKERRGPVLLLAGPGTGKTHKLAQVVRELIVADANNKDKITLITFTEEAKRNMKNRLSDEEKEDVYLPLEQHPHQICTMHSLGHRIISENSQKLGLNENISVLTSDKLKEILLGDAAHLAGFQRDKWKETAECRRIGDIGDCDKKEDLDKCKICNYYRKLLTTCNAIDYDDQIMLAIKLLKENPEILQREKNKAEYLLVDEYQDINAAQFELIKLLSDDQRGGLLVVGDDAQSIYSFRGGTPQYIRDFKRHFSNSHVISEKLCRRCPPNILKGAVEVIKHFDNESISIREEFEFINRSDTKIKLYDVPSEEKEAEIIAREVKELLPKGEVLILIPKWGFADPVKKAFRKYHINYECRPDVEKTGFKILDVARAWLENPQDNSALREIIQFLIENGFLNNIPSARVRKPQKKQERDQILDKISQLWRDVMDRNISLYKALEEKHNNDDFLSRIFEILENLKKSRNKDPQEFINIIRPWKTTDKMLTEIREWLEEAQSRESGESVRILTMHGAKGSEADYVFIVGLDEGVFPVENNEVSQEEQARLLFVSMTRAKKELYLFHARKRSSNITYHRNSYALKLSPFVKTISTEYILKKYIQANR